MHLNTCTFTRDVYIKHVHNEKPSVLTKNPLSGCCPWTALGISILLGLTHLVFAYFVQLVVFVKMP